MRPSSVFKAFFALLVAMSACFSCTRPSSRSRPSASEPAPSRTADVSWLAIPGKLPEGWSLQGVFDAPEQFPLYAEFGRHHGLRARMAAFRALSGERTWWVVDTRYAFASEPDAARFLRTHAARLAEGHPLLDPSFESCGRPLMLFGGPVRHPGTGTFFFTFVAVGRWRHYLFSFLAASEIAGEDDTDAGSRLRPDFLRILREICPSP